MIADWPILSIIIWFPIIGGFLILSSGNKEPDVARWLALVITIITFILSLLLWKGFIISTAKMQFVENLPWIIPYNINYHLGIDGISMPLILLTTFIMVLVVVASWQNIKYQLSVYMAAFLIMEGIIIGVFSALDAMLFYIFWEAMLIPMFLIIGIWGGEHRVYATIKFFLYTFLGSIFMLVALLYMYFKSGSMQILDFHVLKLTIEEQILIFTAFLLAFAVKVPMWPVHTWLPDAHVEAPTSGSVILAAIMLKIGCYGFLRLSLPITPDASKILDLLIILMSLIAIVYISFIALVQQDMKKLIAYSSISHMGFVTLGFFSIFMIQANQNSHHGALLSIEGAIVQMISHGFISAAMFLCVGMLYDRVHSRKISDYGGIVNVMPWFAIFMVFFAISNAGLPGTSGFVGEFMVIIASFRANFWFALLAATTLIIGAAYTLWMIKRVIFGDIQSTLIRSLEDLNIREASILGSLTIMILLIGLWPAPLIEIMDISVNNLVKHITLSKLEGFN